MRSNEQIEVMNWRDKAYHSAVMAPAALGSGEAQGADGAVALPLRRLVIIEKRPLLRECLERCFMSHEPEEIVSYASVDLFIAQLETGLS